MPNKRVIGLTMGMGALLALALGIAVVIHGCGPADHHVPFEDIGDLARKSSLRFPPGSRLLDGYWYGFRSSWGWGNTYAYARVDLPPDQVTQFFKQPVFGGVIRYGKEPLEELDEINVAQPAHDAALLLRWNLTRVRKSASAQGGELNSGQNPVAAFVDLDDPAHPLLYLHWYN